MRGAGLEGSRATVNVGQLSPGSKQLFQLSLFSSPEEVRHRVLLTSCYPEFNGMVSSSCKGGWKKKEVSNVAMC